MGETLQCKMDRRYAHTIRVSSNCMSSNSSQLAQTQILPRHSTTLTSPAKTIAGPFLPKWLLSNL